MAVPTQITVTGTFIDDEGSPEVGFVDFTMPHRLVSSADSTVLSAGRRRATLNSSGAISIVLHSTNDPDWSPVGWTWHVTEQLRSGGTREYEIGIPYNTVGGTVDLSELPPVNAAEGQVEFGIQSVNGDFGPHVTVEAAGAILETEIEAKGDLLVGTADNTVGRLGVGTDGQVLKANSGTATGLEWAAEAGGGSGITESLIDAKGDLIAGSAADTAARLGVGSDGQFLVAASGQATGLEWRAIATADVPTHNHAAADTTSGQFDIARIPTGTSGTTVAIGNDTRITGAVQGPGSATDNAVVRFDSTTGKLAQNSSVTISDTADIAGVRSISRAYASDVGLDTYDEIDFAFIPSTLDADLERIIVEETAGEHIVCWRNEVGFLRGTPHEDFKYDALVRGRGRSDFGVNDGGYIELQDSASDLLHARRWTDGALLRGDGSGDYVECADTIVLGPVDPVPAGTPVGTVIVRTS